MNCQMTAKTNGFDRKFHDFAEFEFSETIKIVALEHLHFSQRRAIFEIGWKERGQDVELRVHLVPQEIDESRP